MRGSGSKSSSSPRRRALPTPTLPFYCTTITVIPSCSWSSKSMGTITSSSRSVTRAWQACLAHMAIVWAGVEVK